MTRTSTPNPPTTLTAVLTGRKLAGAYVAAVALYLFAVVEIVTIARSHEVIGSLMPSWLRPILAALSLMYAVRKTIHIVLSEMTRERAAQREHDESRRLP